MILGWTGVKFKANLKGSNVEMEDFMVCIPEISLLISPLWFLVLAPVYDSTPIKSNKGDEKWPDCKQTAVLFILFHISQMA